MAPLPILWDGPPFRSQAEYDWHELLPASPADKERDGEAARDERELADGGELSDVDREQGEHHEYERSDRKHLRDHGGREADATPVSLAHDDAWPGGV